MGHKAAACLVIDRARFVVYVDHRPVAPTRVEFDILDFLARNSHRVVPYAELLQDVIHSTSRVDTSLIRVHVCNLRRKLGPAAALLRTVPGRGLILERGSETERGRRAAINAELATT